MADNESKQFFDAISAELSIVRGKKKLLCNVTVSIDKVTWYSCESEESQYSANGTLLNASILKAVVEEQGNNCQVCIHHVEFVPKKKEILVKRNIVTFIGEQSKCHTVADAITTLLKQETHRPKKVLFFMNPKSGLGKAEQNYAKLVAPVLEFMNVEVDLVRIEPGVTDTNKIIEDYDLSTIDIVTICGGDGTIASICNSLITKTQREGNVDINDANASLGKVSVPVAIIPSGTGNGQTVIFNYSKDIGSAVLSLVLGYRTPRDMWMFYSNSTYQGSCMIILGFGLLGMVREYVESKRSLGMLRYAVLAVYALLKKREPFDIDIEYLQHGDEGETTWQTVSCPVTAVNVFPLLHPGADISTGHCILTWLNPRTFSQRLGYLKNVVLNNMSYFERQDYITLKTVTEYKVRTELDSRRTRLIEFDGEVLELPSPNLHVRVRQGLIDVICFNPFIVPEGLLEKYKIS